MNSVQYQLRWGRVFPSKRNSGTVIHYDNNLFVAVLDLKEPLVVEDLVAFRGLTTNFEQEIQSIQVDHQDIEMAGKGFKVAVKVKGEVRAGDSVFKLT